MKKNLGNIMVGLFIILVAAYYIMMKMDVVPNVSIVKAVFTVFFGIEIVFGLFRKKLFVPIMSAAILLCMYDSELGIEKITPWPVLLAAFALVIGLSLIFKKGRFVPIEIHNGHEWRDGSGWTHLDEDNVIDVEGNEEESEHHKNGKQKYSYKTSRDGRKVRIDSSFSGTTKYIQNQELEEVDIDNSFGEFKIYFENITPVNDELYFNVDNSFGSVSLYIPAEWNIHFKMTDNVGGNIYDKRSHRENRGPVRVTMDVDTSFGNVNIFDI